MCSFLVLNYQLFHKFFYHKFVIHLHQYMCHIFCLCNFFLVNYLLEILPKILDTVGQKTLVIDLGSTKEAICSLLENHSKRSNYLAAHPMAGTEFSGPSAAQKGLYIGKTNIICEFEKTDNKLGKFALEIFEGLKMKTIYMDSKSHDVHVAYVSHLSHVSSFMLGKTVIEKEKNEDNIFDLAGSGFESTVRLAKSNPKTWTPIFLQNKTNLAAAIEEYVSNLNFLALLKNDSSFVDFYIFSQ